MSLEKFTLDRFKAFKEKYQTEENRNMFIRVWLWPSHVSDLMTDIGTEHPYFGTLQRLYNGDVGAVRIDGIEMHIKVEDFIEIDLTKNQ